MWVFSTQEFGAQEHLEAEITIVLSRMVKGGFLGGHEGPRGFQPKNGKCIPG